MPRKRHVSRNLLQPVRPCGAIVMPRKRHVSRNFRAVLFLRVKSCHASQEACE